MESAHVLPGGCLPGDCRRLKRHVKILIMLQRVRLERYLERGIVVTGESGSSAAFVYGRGISIWIVVRSKFLTKLAGGVIIKSVSYRAGGWWNYFWFGEVPELPKGADQTVGAVFSQFDQSLHHIISRWSSW